MAASASPVRIADANVADRLAESVRRLQRRELGCVQPVDQIRQHRARFHRRQLVGIADEDQPRIRAHRLQQSRHHRQRHHRRLVDDDHVVRQPIAPVVPEPRRRVRPAPEQPVQRRRMHSRQRLLVGLVQLADLQLHRLLQSCRRLARRRRQRDPQSRACRQATPAAAPPSSSYPYPDRPSAPSTLAPTRLSPPRAALRSPPGTAGRCQETPSRASPRSSCARRRRPAVLRASTGRGRAGLRRRAALSACLPARLPEWPPAMRRRPATADRPHRPALRPIAGRRTPTRCAAPAPPSRRPARPSRPTLLPAR